jgi:hypothetical protein
MRERVVRDGCIDLQVLGHLRADDGGDAALDRGTGQLLASRPSHLSARHHEPAIRAEGLAILRDQARLLAARIDARCLVNDQFLACFHHEITRCLPVLKSHRNLVLLFYMILKCLNVEN